MDWRTEYKHKIVSAQQAVKCIQSGDRVLIGHGCGEPSILVDAMVERAPELRNVELVHMVSMGKSEYCKPEMKDSFYFNGCFLGAATRQAVKDGRGDYIPLFYYQMPQLLMTKNPIDVALIQVSAPDENGNCSFGVSVDYTECGVRNPKTKVIMQVNHKMPFTYGTTVHLSRADFIVEAEQDLIELAPPKIGPIEEGIGKHIAMLVPDGATLQLGIGALPDAVLSFLNDKKDLGIHTEMFSDGVVKLAEEGIINNSKKTLHPGKFVATFLMGTKKLYDFVDKNPDVLMFPVDYVNDPFVSSQNDNLISINSCIQVDLMGQVNSESIGLQQYSGVGGQVDFVRGAARSKGGKAIIGVSSTAKNGTVSRIVARLDHGAAVTTSRNDVMYVVTEYGIAELFGLNLRQRAKALIEIAHPKFREQLEKEAWELGILK